MNVKLCEQYLAPFFGEEELAPYLARAAEARRQLAEGDCPGREFLGWQHLPETIDPAEVERILAAAEQIRRESDALIVVGIGGSYLGAHAAIEFLQGPLHRLEPGAFQVFFAGCDLCGGQLEELIRLCETKRVSLNVISKSGTTTEPAMAFRVLRQWMEKRYGAEEAARRIWCTTDREKGVLRQMARREGYGSFVVPGDIGGRYSVLSAVGLLPMAAAGIDIRRVLAGAAAACRELEDAGPHNPACRYAAIRNLLYGRGRKVELFASYEPRFAVMGEWLKQLFGESEGKEGRGIFPASATFSTDLHSLGQYLQEGTRQVFETVFWFERGAGELTVPRDEEDLDGLGFLAGRTFRQVAWQALQGTMLSHTEGGTPNLLFTLPDMGEESLGSLIYFLELACAVSGLVLGVNPFDQPGVEGYKANMFALLGRPGYEERRAQLLKRL